MSTRIHWFSATGNTWAAAAGLANRLSARGESVSLLPMSQAAQDQAQRVIFAFPLFYLCYPQSVRDFLVSYPFDPAVEYGFLVTRGFRGMGGVLQEGRHDLKARNARLAWGIYLDMPNNDVVLFAPHQESKAQAKLARTEIKLNAAADSILNGSISFDAEPFGLLRATRTSAYQERIRHAHRQWFASQSCTGRGICAKLCPLDCLSLVDGRPVWQSGCQECEACVNWCPVQAIQYRGARTESKSRYTHPAASWKDIARQRR